MLTLSQLNYTIHVLPQSMHTCTFFITVYIFLCLQEQTTFFANGVETNEVTFQQNDRYVPLWVRLASPFLRRYL